VIQNKVYRITLIDSRYRELYLVRFYGPTIALAKEVEKILPKGAYTVSLVEFDFHFNCPDEGCANDLYQFLKESHHLSYLKKPSLVLKGIPGTSYRSNPRLSKSMAVRIYITRWNPKAPKIEYVAKRRWIGKNGIESLLDCFLVSPQAVTKNSSFRRFDYAEVEKGLRRGGIRSNIAARLINRGQEILKDEGFHAAYRYFAKRIPALYRPVFTPAHAFDDRFRSTVEILMFMK
jgi:hypothetical protein